jgi:prevent-host-death family protein
MRKTISTQTLKTHVGEVVDSVRLRGDRYIIERRGKPVAAIVPLSVNEADERRRKRFFDMVDAIRQRTRDVPPEVIDQAIEESIAEVRAERARKRKLA